MVPHSGFDLHLEKGTKVFNSSLKNSTEERKTGNSQAVQWLGLSTFTIMGPGSILGWETKIPQVAWLGFKNKKKKERKTIRKCLFCV